MASCGGVSRNYRGFARGCYANAMPLGVNNVLFAELMAFMLAVEIVKIGVGSLFGLNVILRHWCTKFYTSLMMYHGELRLGGETV